jgi:hypothetical protein
MLTLSITAPLRGTGERMYIYIYVFLTSLVEMIGELHPQGTLLLKKDTPVNIG